MVKKISSAKDLELDHMQLKVKAFEGRSMHACMQYWSMLFPCLVFVHILLNYLSS